MGKNPFNVLATSHRWPTTSGCTTGNPNLKRMVTCKVEQINEHRVSKRRWEFRHGEKGTTTRGVHETIRSRWEGVMTGRGLTWHLPCHGLVFLGGYQVIGKKGPEMKPGV